MRDILEKIGSAAGLLDTSLLGLSKLLNVAIHGVLLGRFC